MLSSVPYRGKPILANLYLFSMKVSYHCCHLSVTICLQKWHDLYLSADFQRSGTTEGKKLERSFGLQARRGSRGARQLVNICNDDL